MEVEARVFATGVVVALRGRLTLADHERFRAVLDSADRAAGSSLVIDLSGLSFLDSSGLGLLLMVCERARGRVTRLALRDPQPAIARLLRAACLDTLFEIDQSVPA